MYTERLSEQIAVVGTIDPALRDNTTADSDVIDMKLWRRVLFLVLLGATDIVVDFALRGSNNSDGSSSAAITGKSVTQLSATDDNEQVMVEITAEELETAGYRYVFGRVTIGDGTLGANVAVAVLAGEGRYRPASDHDLASVSEIVA